jgi:hypothetical protein
MCKLIERGFFMSVDIKNYVDSLVKTGFEKYDAGYPYAVGVLQANLEGLINGDERLKEIIIKTIKEFPKNA